MRTKTGFHLNDVCGQKIMVAEGRENIDFNNIIAMNETSAWLWEQVQDKDFSAETLANLLTEQYEVDHETALADAESLTKQWLEIGLIVTD